MFSLLLALIYTAFISLGLPDGLLGSAWPAIHEEMRIPVLELTDRNSMRNAFESLMEILENLIERKTMSFSEWRAEMGI